MSDDARYIVGTYARQPFEFVSGRGSTLYDPSGKAYIDFYSGIAVNALGHSHPAWVSAVQQQAAQLCHVSNLFYSQPQVQLAKALVTSSTFHKVFFCNSGTEANEAALKFARKYAYLKARAGGGGEGGAHDKVEFVACNGGFHGRTMGALSLTYKKAYKEPFRPLVEGVRYVDFNDVEGVEAAITERTCGVFVEPVQGEGGVHLGTSAFLSAIRRRCDAVGALMICDEVQVGLGRMGRLFCHQHFPDIQPDMVTLAKPLAGGLPIGAVLVTQPVADAMQPGDHGTTFAGGPLVCKAALATLGVIAEEGFLREVREKGAYLVERLRGLRRRLEREGREGGVRVVDIRSMGYSFERDEGEGQGLLVGLELNAPVKEIITRAAQRGVVCIGAGEQVLRLVPPLVITKEEIDAAVDVIEDICATCTVVELR